MEIKEMEMKEEVAMLSMKARQRRRMLMEL
jgi:hypothetical protein